MNFTSLLNEVKALKKNQRFKENFFFVLNKGLELVRSHERIKCTVIGILPRETPATLHGSGEDLGRGVPITHPPRQVGVVSVPFKTTSSELNRCPKGHHH